MKSEKITQYETRVFLGQQDDLVLYRNNTGKVMHEGRMLHFGLCVGSADLIGIFKTGRFIAIEMKKEKGGKKALAQRRFIALINSLGGAAAFIHSVEGAADFLKDLRAGIIFPAESEYK